MLAIPLLSPCLARAQREQAWAIRPYPCIGLGTFLRPALPNIPAYDTILKRLQQGESLVDIGCFIGHDLRRLVADGAPSEHVYAVDVANFWDVGYDMFRDRDRFSAHFIEADILSPNSEFQALHGTVDIVSIVSILHLWDLDTQMTAVRQLVKLLRPNAMVVGFQIGSASASVGPKGHFRHDAVSFANMWDQVGQETGTRWSCDAELKGFEEMGFDSSESAFLGADARILQFVLNRTE